MWHYKPDKADRKHEKLLNEICGTTPVSNNDYWYSILRTNPLSHYL